MTDYQRSQVFLLAQTGHNLDEISEMSGVDRTECSLMLGTSGIYCLQCINGSKDFDAAEAAVQALEASERSVVKNPMVVPNEAAKPETSATNSATSSKASPSLSARPIR